MHVFGGYFHAICQRILEHHGEIHHPQYCPFGLFRAKDGWVSIACPNQYFWQVLAEAIGRPDMSLDARYINNKVRGEHREEVNSAIEGFTCRHTTSELSEILGGKIAFGHMPAVA